MGSHIILKFQTRYRH